MAIYSYKWSNDEIFTQTKTLAIDQAKAISVGKAGRVEVYEHEAKIGTPTERIVLALNHNLFASSQCVAIYEGGRKLPISTP
jgi:hypothetical protein